MSACCTADERATAVRCVDCPTCGAVAGDGCMNWHGASARTHLRRVNKYYVDTYGPDSPAVKELLAKAEPAAPRSLSTAKASDTQSDYQPAKETP